MQKITEVYSNGELIATEIQEISKQEQIGIILAKLDDIDRKSIRALRADEKDTLAFLEAEAASLRQDLVKLRTST